jgi:hypothetical protein
MPRLAVDQRPANSACRVDPRLPLKTDSRRTHMHEQPPLQTERVLLVSEVTCFLLSTRFDQARYTMAARIGHGKWPLFSHLYGFHIVATLQAFTWNPASRSKIIHHRLRYFAGFIFDYVVRQKLMMEPSLPFSLRQWQPVFDNVNQHLVHCGKDP